ncbi:MAG: hypothetical protein CMA64_05900 [Euryarchaeota archaeon]|nr:hypothetical protein [Euryarchaeota archaeon]
MKDIINKIKGFGKKKEVKAKPLTAEEERRKVLAKEKELATKKNEPWVAVLDTKVNPENIKNGFFELDWNNEFVEKLIDAGYTGASPEEIVDGWFKTIARQILEDEGLDTDRGAGFINTKTIGKDKSEVK